MQQQKQKHKFTTTQNDKHNLIDKQTSPPHHDKKNNLFLKKFFDLKYPKTLIFKYYFRNIHLTPIKINPKTLHNTVQLPKTHPRTLNMNKKEQKKKKIQ